MNSFIKTILLGCIVCASLSACKKNKSNDPSPENPQEVGAGDVENITRISLIIDSGTRKDTVNFSNTKKDSLFLAADSIFNVEVKIYDDTKKPVVIVSDEIKTEANFHRFHYTFTATSGTPIITTTITDQDTETPAQPLGLTFNLKTGTEKGKGKLKVNLRHFAEGIQKSADPSAGEQDIMAEFLVRIY